MPKPRFVKALIAADAVKSHTIKPEARKYFEGFDDGHNGNIDVLKAADSEEYNYGWGDANSQHPERNFDDYAIKTDGFEC